MGELKAGVLPSASSTGTVRLCAWLDMGEWFAKASGCVFMCNCSKAMYSTGDTSNVAS